MVFNQWEHMAPGNIALEIMRTQALSPHQRTVKHTGPHMERTAIHILFKPYTSMI